MNCRHLQKYFSKSVFKSAVCIKQKQVKYTASKQLFKISGIMILPGKKQSSHFNLVQTSCLLYNWIASMMKLGEAIPIETNRVWLSKDQKDECGMLCKPLSSPPSS